jgi:hypothetical protein
VLAPPGSEGCWDERLAFTLVRRDGLLPPARPQAAANLLYDDFDPPPSEVSAPAGARETEIGDLHVHVFSAPAAVRWRLAPGRYKLSASYGMVDEAWQARDPSDGALVFVALQEGHEVEQLYRRLLDPRQAVEDRGLQPLELEFEVRAPSDLYLRVREGWHGDANRDWVYWGRVKLEKL